jgi:hypothetical protein
LAASRVECISDRDVGIFVWARCRRVAADVNMSSAGHRHMNANAIGITLVVPVLRTGVYHARRRDAIMEVLQPLRLLADGCLECIGMPDVLKYNLQGYLH